MHTFIRLVVHSHYPCMLWLGSLWYVRSSGQLPEPSEVVPTDKQPLLLDDLTGPRSSWTVICTIFLLAY